MFCNKPSAIKKLPTPKNGAGFRTEKGLDKKVLAKTFQNTGIGEDLTREAVSRQVARSFKFKGEKVPAKDAKKLITGIKRIQQIGGKEAIGGIKLKDVLEAGEGRNEHRDTIKKCWKNLDGLTRKEKQSSVPETICSLKMRGWPKSLRKRPVPSQENLASKCL